MVRSMIGRTSVTSIALTLFGVFAVVCSMAGYWGPAAFSPSIFLTLVSLPAALCCYAWGARRAAVVAAYFGILAWLPFVVGSQSTFRFGSGWLLIFAFGLILAVTALVARLGAILREWALR